MSKRFIYPQQHGERKKAKLDISISDHNFPLSQNSEFGKETDNWGDENDDEILLLASQACEEAYNDFSQVPDYSLCMHPGTTSTQLHPQPGPSNAKIEFNFKKPSLQTPSAISTKLKEKCSRISSPLPGISSKVVSKTDRQVNLTDDLIFNDKIFNNQDSDYVYRQLLQLQEENAKLKSENGKLLEKCVTKEGEASILRTQLKTYQVAVDNVRLEKIKAQEKVQIEWTEKLTAANNQMHDLRNQLDFKNLEIISIKEKCKKLESTKVKLTQVTVGGNDISTSHRNNSITQYEPTIKRVKAVSSSVQTEEKAHLLTLNKTLRPEVTELCTVLPLMLGPTVDQHHSILDYNEKLQHTDLSQNKCRIYSTFHRVPSTPVPKENIRSKVALMNVYEDVTCLASSDCDDMQKYFNIFGAVSSALDEVHSKLETVAQRMTTSFQKEMDEKYIEVSAHYLDVCREDLLKGRALYKDEQDILSRRMVAMLSYILDTTRSLNWFKKFEENSSSHGHSTAQCSGRVVDTVCKITALLDTTVRQLISNVLRVGNALVILLVLLASDGEAAVTAYHQATACLLATLSCATLYSGLLQSIISFIQRLTSFDGYRTIILDIIKMVLTSRPMLFVVTQILDIMRSVSACEDFMKAFCPGTSLGNLKTDYDQGVLLFKRDSCYIQMLVKQTEVCLKCIERQQLTWHAIEATRNLIILYGNINNTAMLARSKSRCDCQLILVQVMVYALRICAVMLDNIKNNIIHDRCGESDELSSVCLCGVQLLYQCAARDLEFSSQLAHDEGHLIHFCELMRGWEHADVYTNMLSELAGTLQSSPEDMPPSFHKQPWLKSFESFTLTD